MLSIDFGQDIPLKRPVMKFGEKISVATSTVFGTWQMESPDPENAQRGNLYVYRGADVRDGDTVVIPLGRNDDGSVRGVNFTVIGDAKWNQVNALDGEDFGILKFELVRGG